MIPTAALPHRVRIERYLGATAYGPKWGPPVPMRARITGKRRTVKTGDGIDVIADATCVVRPCRPIATESRVTDTHGRVYTVAGVTENPGLTRGHNIELILTGPRPAGGE